LLSESLSEDGKMVGHVKRIVLTCLSLSLFTCPAWASGPLFINEVMAANSSVIKDPQGQYDDWIEIYNAGDRSIDVGGMYLTDDLSDPTKWRIPANKPATTTIAAGGFLILWMDGDTADAGLHAGFKLRAEGEEIALFDKDGTTLVDSMTFKNLPGDTSYARLPDGGQWQFMVSPTPGGPNLLAYSGTVADVEFSHDRGFYDTPFDVALTCKTAGVTIYYTVDGTEPYIRSHGLPIGRVYAGPIPITKTTCLRAIAVKPEWLSHGSITHTYIFLSNVLVQPAKPSGFPQSWGSKAADYEMDPDIVKNARYAPLMNESLLSIPSISVVAGMTDLFDSQKGIYANPTQTGVTWERPCSVELIYPDGTPGFQVNCGIRIQGGAFRSWGLTVKKSFRLLFKSIYGPSELHYPLFGDGAVDHFNTITLRAGANDGYSWNAARYTEQYTRDEFGRVLQRTTGNPGSHGMFAHLYVNGLYWGLYNPSERPDASFSASYCGGQADDWDSLHDAVAGTGDTAAWSQMLSLCRAAATSNDAYQRLQGRNPDGTPNPAYPNLLNVTNYIDYLIVNLWGGNWDWPWKNWYAARDRRANSTGYQFYCWDYENTMGNNRDRSPLNKNALNNSFSSAGEPHQSLKQNAEYRMLFADRVHRFMLNGSALTPTPLISRYESLAAMVEKAIIAESARWGDQSFAQPLTQQDWLTERNWILNTYLPQRTAIVLDQFRSASLYPNVEAPTYYISNNYQHGGHITSADSLSLRSSGFAMYYTLDGSDPRSSGQSSQPGGAGSTTIVAENAAKRVLVPTGPISDAWRGGQLFDDAAWTSVTGSPGGVGFERSTGYEQFISFDTGGQMYSKQPSCYIRIPFTLNSGLGASDTVQLRARYDDGFIAYINGVEIARANFTGEPAWNSGASTQNSDADAVILADIHAPNAKNAIRQGLNILAIQAMNAGSSSSDFLLSVTLTSTQSSSGGDGNASTGATRYNGPIKLSHSARVKARTLTGSTWSALNEAVFAVGPVAQSLRISEIMYHPADTGKPTDPNTEFIELTNIGSETINLNLVTFANGVDFTFPSFELAPGRYCLVVRDTAAFEAKYGSGLPVAGRYAGNLNNAGERLELLDAAGTVIHDFRFEDDWFDITDGQGFSLTARDLQADPNTLGDKSVWRPSAKAGGSPGADDSGQVPLPGAVVINELLASSQGTSPDWIELHNTTNQTVSIGGWFLSDDPNNLTKYRIASGASIPAGGYIVFYENRHFGNRADPGCKEPFALSADGETVYLHSGSNGVLTGYSGQEKFDASEAGVSLGRHEKTTGAYSFVALSKPTPGAANATPQVGPVVINEIMYHPDAPADAEYVELLNITGDPVTLYDIDTETPWRFTDDPDDPAIDLLLPTDVPVVLGPGEYLVLAKDESLLRSKYNVPANVKVLAWGAGNLADGVEKTQISKPGDTDGQDNRIWIRVDRVVYSDGSHPLDFPGGVDPWPVQADGQGSSLSRIAPAAYGNDPTNWRARSPSPGRANP
jgi:hypothetical protein